MRFRELILLFFQISLIIAVCSCSSNTDKKDISVPQTIENDTCSETIKEEQQEIEDVFRREDSILQSIGMLRIDEIIPEIKIDMKYASENNFLGFDFYNGFKHAYAQKECIDKLKTALDLLHEEDSTLSFVIFDAARSIESQKLMWDSVKIEGYSKINFVANPERGSIHNYGMALDLSIVDKDGNYLDMGSEFDFFGPISFPNKTDYYYSIGELSEEQYKNRILLMNIMRKAGFYVSKTEWWHYNAGSLKRAKDTYNIYTIKNTEL